MNKLKPIETIYRGYKFRSRLEARWAIFFDEIGIAYEYEKEGYDLGDKGLYLPDFWISKWNKFAEIRPSNRYEYDDKCEALAKKTGLSVLHISGNPYLTIGKYGELEQSEYKITLYSASYGPLYGNPMIFTRCRRCNGIDLLPIDEKNSCFCWVQLGCDSECDTDKYPTLIDSNINNAYIKARQARFEHGEKG